METRRECGVEHEFVLILDGIHELSADIMSALFEAGCADATPSVRSGRVYLTFVREAPSLRKAVLSAIRDVLSAEIGARVRQVDSCNLVTQAEIARRCDRTRQQVGQWIAGTRGPGDFPPPACDLTENHPLWHWCEVSYWLHQRGIVGEDVLNEARDVELINTVISYLGQKQQDSAFVEEVAEVMRHAP